MAAKSDAPAPKLTEEQKLVLGIARARAQGKQKYDQAKAYLARLKSLSKPGSPIPMPDGRKFAIVDTFEPITDYAKKMIFFDRYELQELK